jgi:hypothetical protein
LIMRKQVIEVCCTVELSHLPMVDEYFFRFES